MTFQSVKDIVSLPYNERSDEKGVEIATQPISSNAARLKEWKEFADRIDMFPRYRNVSLDTLNIPTLDGDESFESKGKRYIENPKSLILMGKAGRGKTHFMFAILKEMFMKCPGFSTIVNYYDHVQLDRKLKEGIIHIQHLCDVPFLVLDDFGLDTGTSRHERDFYEIFNKRFGKNLVTIISTNLDAAAIHKSYGERISSRFKEALIIEFNGPDLRG